jgi:predicted metal-binding protein
MSEPIAADAPAPQRSEPIVLSVCVSCKAEGESSADTLGSRVYAGLRAAAHAAGATVVVRPVQCLSVCKRPCSVALSSPGRYTYIFGDLDETTGPAALLDCAQAYAEQEHGYLLWRERPEPLRRGIVARIPPAGWTTEDGHHPR